MDKSASLSETKDSLVVFQTSQGLELRATPLRLTRHLVVFEAYTPNLVLRMSEVLNEFRIILKDRPVYAGRAVISSLVNAGTLLVCEASLEDGWMDADLFLPVTEGSQLQAGFKGFIEEWQKTYQVLPEYKVIVADLQTFLADLRLWLEQLELGIRSSPSADRLKLEREVTLELGESTTPALTALFEKFEQAAARIEVEQQPAHRAFGKRQLHPQMLCAPFLYRTFQKPLGYAGDYEMVNMIVRDPCEGSSLFAKILNLWFLRQPPAEAHRNRIDYLTQEIVGVTAHTLKTGKRARVLSLGCGPAIEVQRFLKEKHFSDQADFTLVDFNEETLLHTEMVLAGLKRDYHRSTPCRLVKKSATQILKEAGKSIERSPENQYDFVYCAGLFDYLSDQYCHRLSNILYDWLAPGGLLVTTNVDAVNPRRLTMDYVMEWHLIYRTGPQLARLRPEQVAPDGFTVESDSTGVNVYFKARKPERA